MKNNSNSGGGPRSRTRTRKGKSWLESRRERERTRSEKVIELIKNAFNIVIAIACVLVPMYIGFMWIWSWMTKEGFDNDTNPFVHDDDDGMLINDYFRLDMVQLVFMIINLTLTSVLLSTFYIERTMYGNPLGYSPFYAFLISMCFADCLSVFFEITLNNIPILRLQCPMLLFYLCNAADMCMGFHRLLILTERFTACAWPTFHYLWFNSAAGLRKGILFCWWFGYAGSLMLFTIPNVDYDSMIDRSWYLNLYNDALVIRWTRRMTFFFTAVVVGTQAYGFVLLVFHQIHVWYTDWKEPSRTLSSENLAVLSLITRGTFYLIAFIAPFMVGGMFWFNQFAYGYLAKNVYPILVPIVAWRYWQFYKAKQNMTAMRVLLNFNVRLSMYAIGATMPMITLYMWLVERYAVADHDSKTPAQVNSSVHALFKHDYHWFFAAQIIHAWARIYTPLGVLPFSPEIRAVLWRLVYESKADHDGDDQGDNANVNEHQVKVNKVPRVSR